MPSAIGDETSKGLKIFRLSTLVALGIFGVGAYGQVQFQPGPGYVSAVAPSLEPRVFAQLLAKQSADVQYSKLTVQINDELKYAEAALYEAVLYANVRQEGRYRPRTVQELLTTSAVSFLDERVDTREAGIKSKLPLGGDISLGYKLEDRRNNLIATLSSGAKTSEYNGSLNLTYRQPLLKGFGRDVTEADKRVAELEHEVSKIQYRQQLLKSVSEGLGSYWQLYKAQQTVTARQEAVGQAQRLIRETEARVIAGKQASTVLLELKSVLLNREIELSKSVQSLDDSQSKLLTSIGLDRANSSKVNLTLNARPGTDIADTGTGGGVTEEILQAWPPFAVSTTRQKQALVRLMVAKDQTRPSLDLIVGDSNTGLAYSRKDSISLAYGNRYPDWYIGLNFEVFTSGNEKATAQLRAQYNRITQSELEQDIIKVSLDNDLRSRRVEVQTFVKAVSLSEADVATRQEIYQIEKRRFDLGLSLPSALIQKESDLVDAQIRLLENRVRLEAAVVTMRYLDGTLLSSLGINL